MKARKSAARGGKKTGAQSLAKVYIEGDWFTYDQIADRLAVTRASVYRRLARLRTLAQPVTWEGLSALGPKR